ncbi:MAG: ThiF family adenylyltransferase [Phycisphaeraceae bacterium]|nr:ThiF family adenylyltransferase [Phycisphaeraceae bacterium]
MSDDLARYHRQMLLPGFGEEGQRKLLNAKVLVAGCGALGTVIANMLARAGVGKLVIVDRDFIELTNLQRQVLFDEQDVREGMPKAEAAKRKIAGINSQVQVTAVVDDLNHRNIEELVLGPHGDQRCDLLIDGVDNFETRFLLNDVAVKHGIPYVYGGAVATTGMTYAILPHTPGGISAWEKAAKQTGGNAEATPSPCPLPQEGRGNQEETAEELLPGAGVGATPCLRCIFEQTPPPGMNPTCDTAGVLGPVVSVIANYQVIEAIKILTGHFEAVNPALLSVDVWANTVKQFKVARAYEVGECICCKQRQFEFLEGKFASGTTTLCGRNAVQLTQKISADRLKFEEIAARLRPHGQVEVNKFMLRAQIKDNGQDYELTLFADGRAIIKGTKEANVAKSVYAKYVGV